MRHLKKGRKFGRKRDGRRALMKGLAASFFMLGRIRTTEAKAKELRPLVERYITAAKSPTLAVTRKLAGLFLPAVVKKIFAYGNEMGARRGGYTRIIKLGSRRGDDARMAIIEIVKS